MKLRVDTLRVGPVRTARDDWVKAITKRVQKQNNAAKFLAFTKILALERIQILQLIGCANNIQIGRE